MLSIKDLVVGYGPTEVLRGLSLDLPDGGTVCILGHNGAGKSTLLRTVAGLQKLRRGQILLDGEDVGGKPIDQLVRSGIVLCPSGRHVFPRSSVEFNLEMGGYTDRDRGRVRRDVAQMFDRFPVLAAHRRTPAGQLSGGQQQVVAIARALMARPKVLLMDEPSMGLSPRASSDVFEVIKGLRSEGVSVLLAEQNVKKALQSSDLACVIDGGTVALAGTASDLLASDAIKDAFLGGGVATGGVGASESPLTLKP